MLPDLVLDLVLDVEERGLKHAVECPHVDLALGGGQPGRARAGEMTIARPRGCPRRHAVQRQALHLCLERGRQRQRLRLDRVSADRARAVLTEPREYTLLVEEVSTLRSHSLPRNVVKAYGALWWTRAVGLHTLECVDGLLRGGRGSWLPLVDGPTEYLLEVAVVAAPKSREHLVQPAGLRGRVDRGD
eukprot:scaffold113660_cov75-Phaeocystis_antarctica.AAC.3